MRLFIDRLKFNVHSWCAISYTNLLDAHHESHNKNNFSAFHLHDRAHPVEYSLVESEKQTNPVNQLKLKMGHVYHIEQSKLHFKLHLVSFTRSRHVLWTSSCVASSDPSLPLSDSPIDSAARFSVGSQTNRFVNRSWKMDTWTAVMPTKKVK